MGTQLYSVSYERSLPLTTPHISALDALEGWCMQLNCHQHHVMWHYQHAQGLPQAQGLSHTCKAQLSHSLIPSQFTQTCSHSRDRITARYEIGILGCSSHSLHCTTPLPFHSTNGTGMRNLCAEAQDAEA
jgi:hypothetical protein